jgi:hypothetical protein
MSNKERAKEIFKANPDMEELHFTSDGTPFEGKNNAENHAKSLDGKKVETFSRDEFDLPKEKKAVVPADVDNGTDDDSDTGDNAGGADGNKDGGDAGLTPAQKAAATRLAKKLAKEAGAGA